MFLVDCLDRSFVSTAVGSDQGYLRFVPSVIFERVFLYRGRGPSYGETQRMEKKRRERRRKDEHGVKTEVMNPQSSRLDSLTSVISSACKKKKNDSVNTSESDVMNPM